MNESVEEKRKEHENAEISLDKNSKERRTVRASTGQKKTN